MDAKRFPRARVGAGGQHRAQAARLGAQVQAALDEDWTENGADAAEPLNDANGEGGRTWDRTRDLSRVKRALSR
jgi:hypothetical protein